MLRERDRLNTSLLLRPREVVSDDGTAAGVTIVVVSSATDWIGKPVVGETLELRGCGDSGTDVVLFLMSVSPATDWTGKSVAGEMLELRGCGDPGTDAVLFLMSMTLGAPDFFPTIVK